MIAKISDTRAWNQMGPRSPRMQTDSSFRLRYFLGIRVTPGGRHHGRRRHFRKSPTAWEGLAVQGLAVYACLALLACRLRPARAVPVTVGWPACRRSLPHALRGYAPPGLPPWAAPAPFAAWRACACRRLCPSVPLPGCASSHSASRAASALSCTPPDCQFRFLCCTSCSRHRRCWTSFPRRRRHHHTQQPPMPQLHNDRSRRRRFCCCRAWVGAAAAAEPHLDAAMICRRALDPGSCKNRVESES